MQYKIKRTDSLYHHGILGMQWGKRNGPPYPLSPNKHSASEKKAGWRKSLDNKEPTSKKIKRIGKKITKPIRTSIKNKQIARQRELDKTNAIKDRKKAVDDIRILSDDELKNRIERIKTEQELKRLTESDIAPGRKFVNSVFSDSTKRVATTALTGAAIYGVKYLIDNNFDKSEFAKSVYRGGASKK